MDVVPTHLTEALLGRYQIERELGRGGMATVYLARDERHDRQVALKVLRPELAAVLGRERFLAEIRLTARLNHPGLLTLLDSGQVADTLFYVLPYVPDGSLRDRLTREHQLPIPDAVSIGCRIAEALDYAHRHGVVHRDIKPENILLDAGVPKLTDFGIAIAVQEAGGTRLTETGLVIGTPQYMSPEQATGDRHLDGRSDLYSLGAVIYEMLAGEPPVLGNTAQAIIARLITEKPTPLRVVRSTVPEALSQVVERALAKVPADRFATGAEFAATLMAPPAVSPRRRLRAITAVPILLAVAALATLAGRRLFTPVRLAPPTPSSVIAILPPTTSTPDAALSRLGRDLAFTLAPNLTGAGEIRAVDPEAVLAALGSRPAAGDRSEDLALGRRLGAGNVVRGSLVRVGRDVRWDLTLVGSASGQIVAQATATAPPESLRAFTDTATRSLLRQIWSRGQPPSPSLDAAVKTRSVPALKAFLTGEAAILDGRWDDGAHAYNEAIALDSTFWLAYWRLWYTGAWASTEMDSSLEQVARAHRQEMPDRERLLIEACTCLAENLDVAIRLAKQTTARFPDDWFAWLFYSDYLVHRGPQLGYTAADARDALEHTVALRPGLVDAWDHLLLVSLGKDTAVARRTLHMLDSLGWMRRLSLKTGYDVAPYFRLFQQVMVAPGRVPRPLLDTVARAVAPVDSAVAHDLAAVVLLRFGYPGVQVELDRQILADGVSRRFRPALPERASPWDGPCGAPGIPHLRSARSWRIRTRWSADASSGGIVSRSLRRGSGRSTRPRPERWLSLRIARSRTCPPTSTPKASGPLSRGWTGSWPSRGGIGPASLRLSARPGGATRPPLATWNAPSAPSPIGSMVRPRGWATHSWPRTPDPEQHGAEPMIVTTILSVNRLAGAEAYLSVGDTSKAVRLLVWHEAELNGDNLSPQLFAPFAYLLLARIEEAEGQNAGAREHYEQFLRRYDHPVARLQPLVNRAQAALAQLEGR